MDLLMNRYSNIEYIMDSELKFGSGMIVEAERQKNREEAYKLYTSLFPFMTPETFIPFEQFYRGPSSAEVAKKAGSAPKSSRGPSKDEILESVKEMMTKKPNKKEEV